MATERSVQLDKLVPFYSAGNDVEISRLEPWLPLMPQLHESMNEETIQTHSAN